jgi:hypothetical protein
MPLTADDVDRFESSRRRLEAIAYRLLGSADEAEDVVQETFLRWQAIDVDRTRAGVYVLREACPVARATCRRTTSAPRAQISSAGPGGDDRWICDTTMTVVSGELALPRSQG